MQQQNSGVDFHGNENQDASIYYEYFKSHRGYLGTLNFCFSTFSNELKSLIAHSRLTNKRV